MPTPHVLLRALVPIAALAIMACTPDAPLAPDAPRTPTDTVAADVVESGPQGTLDCMSGTIEMDGPAGFTCYYVPIGYYMPFRNYTYAFSCPLPWTTSGQGATSQIHCNVGALPGSYVSPETHQMTLCPAGLWQPSYEKTSCLSNTPGYYIPEPGVRDQSDQFPCNRGTWSGEAYYVVQDDKFVLTGWAACKPAPAGNYSGFAASFPTPCEPGTYQPSEGQSFCLGAPPGSYVANSGSTFAYPCYAGSYAFGHATFCTLAPAGGYVPGTGATYATACAIGTYQPLIGQAACLPAPIGSYVSFQGAASATPCPAGGTTTAVGATSSAQCVTRPLTLGDAQLWIGLKNSDDVGLRLDVRAEVLLNGLVVGSGELQDIPAGSSGFNNAVLRTIGLAMNSVVSVPAGAMLTFRPSVRRTCLGGGHTSGTVRFWYDGPAIDQGTTRNAGSRFAANVASVSSNFFMRSPATLSTTAGTARQFVDVAVNSNAACPSRPYSSLGEWSITQ